MATTENLPALIRRKNNKSYKNFNVSVYCPQRTISDIKDPDAYMEKFRNISDYVNVGRVYIENLRDQKLSTREEILRAKKMFEDAGYDTAGGITTCAADGKKDGFVSICYSDEAEVEILRKAVILNAEIFDEVIFDDFFFSNCRCKKCIENKGDMTWSKYRLKQREYIAKEVVMKTAKSINPEINVIIKFPQWFEDFNETGYDLSSDTAVFDSIYTGTETRNPTYCAQHLPKYLSYTTMRLYGSDAPGSNLGGWFDPFECTYNITSYLEQAYLTLWGKADEAMIFCNHCFTDDKCFMSFTPALGYVFKEIDSYLGELGNPIGVMAYHPSYGRGENNLHSYLGQCGIPMEPCLIYPSESKDIFLNESASDDQQIVSKMRDSLTNGANITVTSGFVRKMGARFDEFASVKVTSRRALVKDFCVSWSHGVNLGGKYAGNKEIIIPQIDYCTNDVWEMAGAYGTDNNFPLVIRFPYADGNISIITIPDDMGDLYNYPKEVLNVIREQFYLTSPVQLIGPSKVQLFLYDNDTIIVRSDLEYTEVVSIRLPDSKTSATDIVTGKVYSASMESKQDFEEVHPAITLELSSGVNYVLKLN